MVYQSSREQIFLASPITRSQSKIVRKLVFIRTVILRVVFTDVVQLGGFIVIGFLDEWRFV